MPSPGLQEHNPADDLADFWSDWEYYSDDYYDAEPTTKRTNMIGVGQEAMHIGMKRTSSFDSETRRKRPRKESATGEPVTILGSLVYADRIKRVSDLSCGLESE